MASQRVVIFDTTLRDGEQSPGINLSPHDKIELAEALQALRVDVIEAGFAASSESDFTAIREVASRIKDCTVCSLSRAVERDIELTAQAVRSAPSGRIHIVLATSALHMKYKLQQEPEQVLEQAVHAVRFARRFSDNIEFSCEDASRSDFPFLARLVDAVICAGATTVSLPDTVGVAVPEEYGGLLRRLIAEVPSADRAVFSAHCHDDLGLAVANSLAAVHAGARQIECTINGIGERAGNASLEEIVMALRTRAEYFGLHTGIKTDRLVPTSALVARRTGFPVPPNKAIVGRNAFMHESGIHQDGMLKNPLTYQIMMGKDVGWPDYQLVLGKHSGRNGYSARMKRLGVNFSSDAALNSAFHRFKKLADSKRHLEDADLLTTIGDDL
ncbi:2-isopropylmalate synthase [Haliangium sp. UPWRP_2]|uniref:2-isopropylmalate synthase n=1 Tax=Haliangium sp. UPWRP_2 TaxID=1931276 RepID=UPI000B53DC6E|nr:2-isopropylmalate synthase [Haliangium sp. UPWRP_2]PSM31504.1 2-isopropylmalate synthase [Haliangium sp. UPWRP_2]